MTECPETCEVLQKVLEKLGAYKHLRAKEVDLAKLKYSVFLSNTMKVIKSDLVRFNKVTDISDTFLLKYIGENSR